jgi:stearoyl-CoA 9-desaturase NADPH oxidoreductase
MASAVREVASSFARRLMLDRQAEFWLGKVDPTWSLGEIRARVLAVVDETPDTKTFVLRPNSAWRGHRAGQHTMIEVEIDGVRVRRCYSLSSAPDELPAITVKRAPGGRVSGWLHDRVRPGHVLRMTAAGGDFLLPEPVPPKLLLLGGGSGVTPLMSMLRDLAARDRVSDLVFVHHARSREDAIFCRALSDLAMRHRGLRLHLGLSDGTSGLGRFDEARLRELVPDFAERDTFLCGPPGLMQRVERLWADAGAAGRLRRERFVAAPAPAQVGGREDAPTVRVSLTRSGRSFAASSGTLLEQLERAGERPRFGCRMGICQSCKCRKRSGRVENLVSGAVSNEPEEDIQPCISVARSDVELCL